LKKIILALSIILLLLSCSPEIKTDYQEFFEKNYSTALYILNGEAETISAYSPEDQKLYRDLQTLGHNGSSEAWPNDVLQTGGSLYTVCSGQNVIEQYDGRTLDYKGKIYLKNGFNPLTVCPLGSDGQAAIAGFQTDEIVLVNLNDLSRTSDFLKVYEEVNLPSDSHRETSVPPTTKNATGENRFRRPTGIAASDSALYVTNVRYDTSILLTDTDGNLIDYKGSPARAAGYFREGTLSVFETDGQNRTAALIREIDLDAAYALKTGKPYFPGNGLNPQSVFVLEGKLHIVCTGTNGGDARQYTDGEYIPAGYSAGDTVPGTDPDDGVILVMNLAAPLEPVLEKVIPIGGSPAGFRSSMDPVRKILYLAGVGGIQSYDYAGEKALRDSSNPILAGTNPAEDYYSHVLYEDNMLYISDYSHDRLNRILVSGSSSSPGYERLDSLVCGDGPGAMAFRSE